MKLLGRQSTNDLLPAGPPPGIKEPTLQSFYFKWDEPTYSLFNMVACNIVTQQVVSDFPALFTDDDHESVAQMVASHFGYLSKVYKGQHLPPTDATQAARLRRCSADTRMRTVCLFCFGLWLDANIVPAVFLRRLNIVSKSSTRFLPSKSTVVLSLTWVLVE